MLEESMLYSLSRLSVIDVKWTGLLDTKENPSFYERHHNPYHELILAADGNVRLQTGNFRTTLQTGDSFLLKPWEQHEGWNSGEGGGKFYWVQFSCDPALNEFVLHRAPELNIVHAERTELRTVEHAHEDLLLLPRQFHNRNKYAMLGLFEQLVETMGKSAGYFRYRATLLLAEMLRLLADDYLEQSRLNISSPASYLTFRKLADHLNNSFETDIAKDRLEALMERKYEYLNQLFKKYAGIPMHLYIRQLRMQRAQYLLRHTGKTVKEIALEVGYPDPFYFSRLFKKMQGIGPQEYRNGN
jgi:AraC-like DNA-binding protein